MIAVSDNLFLFEDTCNVYIVREGERALLIDFGSGDVLDCLEPLGVREVIAVLMTHHHRDQGQGLKRAVERGIPIWVPQAEQDLFHSVEAHWQARPIYNNYNVRQDRFSLRESVSVAGTLDDYAAYEFGPFRVEVAPTPGHTVGSISLLTPVDGRRAAFTGDLIAGPGKVWSLAATQWTYNGAEGVTMSLPSLAELKRREPDVLLPSHGEVMRAPDAAIDLLAERLRALAVERKQDTVLLAAFDQPYEAITPHLLWNRTSTAYSYVLVSESGKALVIDYGYDFVTRWAAGSDRASRRPWLYSLAALKRDFGVTSIDVAIATHYHDDHVAGFNLLRRVEGTAIWAAENFADVLERPGAYDLPCLWYDPIPVSRVLPLSVPVRWEEFLLVCYPQPGHTRYAVAIAIDVDGKRVLAIGDQYQGRDADEWNYVYANRFDPADYRQSADLYRAVRPDLILSGHSEPHWVTPDYLDRLTRGGEAIERLHRELLPAESPDLGADSAYARLQPYQAVVKAGDMLEFDVEVHNPLAARESAVVRLVAPPGWDVMPALLRLDVAPHQSEHVRFQVRPGQGRERRARVAVDITIGGHRYGEQAEALVSVV